MNTLDAVVFALPDVLQARHYKFALGLPEADQLESWRIVQPDCLLPAFLVIAEGLWRQATQGAGFGLRIEEDAISALGYSVTGLFHVPAAVALVALDAAFDRMAGTDGTITLESIGAALVRGTA